MGILKKVDIVSSAIFGTGGAEKLRFGTPPKKTTAGPSVALAQVVIRKVEEGRSSHSVFLDWRRVRGAGAYRVECFADPAMMQLAQNATVTISECEFEELTQGVQYWIRVCAVRGREHGQWSDVATKVAGL